MSLNIALQYAVSGLNATQSQLQVLAGNIANAQTPGYSEETLPQTADAATNGGAGVVTGEIQRITDQSLQKSLLGQTTQSGGASATSNYQQQVQDLMGQVGSSNSLADYLDAFTNAMQTVAATPQDPSAQASAVNAGQQLAGALNNLSSGIQTLRQNADSQIGTDVGIVNTALGQIAQLNGQISKLQAVGESTATLDDQRDQQLTTVAQYIGVQSFTASDGTMSVLTTSGQNLVTADTAQKFSYTPSGTVTAQTTLSPLTIEGTNVTANTTTGEIGALLQTENTTLPNLTAQLNQVTNNLFAETTDANLPTTNSGLGATNDANHFFAAVNIAGGLDNAATIQVNPDLISNPGLLDQDSDSDPDPSITATLLSNLTGPTSFAAAGGSPATTTPVSNYVAQMIGATATAASSASATATDQSSLLAQMQSEYSNATGVDLDTELSKLVIYQNAYSASARVISTIQSMFDSLMAVSV